MAIHEFYLFEKKLLAKLVLTVSASIFEQVVYIVIFCVLEKETVWLPKMYLSQRNFWKQSISI